MSFLLSNFIELGNDELRKVNGGAASCGGGGTSGSGSGSGSSGGSSYGNSGSGSAQTVTGGSGSCGGSSGSSGSGSSGSGSSESSYSGGSSGGSTGGSNYGGSGNCSGGTSGGSSGGSSGGNSNNGSSYGSGYNPSSSENNSSPTYYGGSGNCNGSTSSTTTTSYTNDSLNNSAKEEASVNLVSLGCSTNLLDGKKGWDGNKFLMNDESRMQGYDTRFQDIISNPSLRPFYKNMTDEDFSDKNRMNGGYVLSKEGCKYISTAKIMSESTGYIIDPTYIRDHVDCDGDGRLGPSEVGPEMQKLLPDGYKVKTQVIKNPTREDFDKIINDSSSLNYVLLQADGVCGGYHWVEGTGYTVDPNGNTIMEYSASSYYDTLNNRVYMLEDVPEGSTNTYQIIKAEIYTIYKE